jgi:hypothetical protein
MPSTMQALESALGDKEYLCGEFSVADVAIGSYLLYIPRFFPEVRGALCFLAIRPSASGCIRTVSSVTTGVTCRLSTHPRSHLPVDMSAYRPSVSQEA